MNLKDLQLPIRAYWDLSPLPQDRQVDYRGICGDIRDIKILSLNLLDTTVPFSRAGMGILEYFQDAAVSISLTLSREMLTPPTVSRLSGLRVTSLFVEVSSLTELRSVAEEMRDLAGSPLILGISFTPGNGALEDLPEALAICLQNRVSAFTLPMERLIYHADPVCVRRRHRNEMQARLGQLDYGSMRIVIHDPFIWEMVFAAETFPGGGCQAANSMVYISPRGEVYPCPSLPIKLGDLREMRLRDILTSGETKDLRKSLAIPAEDCHDCGERGSCHGGCRGRAFAVHRSLSKADPACG